MTPPSSTKKSKPHSRQGALNYWAEDVDFLLDVISHREPHSREDWELVQSDFNHWAERNERPTRSVDSLKDKFDKLAYARKRTGDPTIHPHERKAKIIYRDIQSKALSKAIGQPDGNLNPTEGDHDRAKAEGRVIGVRRKAAESVTGFDTDEITQPPTPISKEPRKNKKQQIDLPLERKLQVDVVRHMETMTTSLLSVAEVIKKSHSQASKPASEELRKVIREELQALLGSFIAARSDPAQRPKHSPEQQPYVEDQNNPLRAFSHSHPNTTRKPF